MELQVEAITISLSSLAIDKSKIIKIQKWFRGCITRLKQLPLNMYKIQAKHFIESSSEYTDIVKLGFGTSLITPNTHQKIKVYQKHKEIINS